MMRIVAMVANALRCARFALLSALVLPAALHAQRGGENLVRFRASNIEVTIRFRDTRSTDMENQIREVMSGALARYTEVFGALPRAMDGTPTVKLTLNVAFDQLGGGSAEPGVLSLLIGRQPAFGFYDWKMTLLHETFHLWNGESFRFAGPGEEWFNEGASEFYAAQTAARLGLMDDLTAIRAAATAVGFYASASGQDRLTLSQAGQQKGGGANQFLVHYGGWTAALLLDRTIRGRTNDAKSLDDVMRWMHANHDRAARRYTTMDVARAVREATGEDLTEFFARHVMGGLPLPVSATINLGELALAVQARGARDVVAPTPDALTLRSLGLRAGR
ncbi:MAG: hypothetical protein WD801_01200 [Gemmatimonadaceae bacterium]